MLRTRLSDALKGAMKSKDQTAVSTLRLILAALKDRDIASRGSDSDEGVGEDDILSLLQSMIKQRRDSIDAFNKGGRTELAEQEAAEIEIIQSFLPEQMDAGEISDAVGTIITECGADSLKQMGQVMTLLRERYAGRMDFGLASREVKAKLG